MINRCINFATQSTFIINQMSTEKEHLENLSQIRSMMERSSRFISLSGLSGIFAGIFALIGAFAAYRYLNLSVSSTDYYRTAITDNGNVNKNYFTFFIIDA